MSKTLGEYVKSAIAGIGVLPSPIQKSHIEAAQGAKLAEAKPAGVDISKHLLKVQGFAGSPKPTYEQS